MQSIKICLCFWSVSAVLCMFVCTPHISLLPGVDFRKLLKALRWHSFCSVHGLLHNTGITVINQICGKNPYRSWTILFGNFPGLCALESHSLHVLGKFFYLWNQYKTKNYCRICNILAKKNLSPGEFLPWPGFRPCESWSWGHHGPHNGHTYGGCE